MCIRDRATLVAAQKVDMARAARRIVHQSQVLARIRYQLALSLIHI